MTADHPRALGLDSVPLYPVVTGCPVGFCSSSHGLFLTLMWELTWSIPLVAPVSPVLAWKALVEPRITPPSYPVPVLFIWRPTQLGGPSSPPPVDLY